MSQTGRRPLVYFLAYLTFSALVSIPWISLDVYANSVEGRPGDLVARIKGLHLPVLLLAFLFVVIATLVAEGYSSLAFWALAGALTSYCFTRMLLAAYERGRMAAAEKH